MSTNNIKKTHFLRLLATAVAATVTVTAVAQTGNAAAPGRSAGSIILEEVVVTGTKKASGEQLQKVPIAITAYNEEQLNLLHVRDLQDLSHTMPNVAMDDIGTFKGIANFTIRGLGINSSIPSIDPTVGVFVDGVYLGTNYGVVFDQFDLAGIEVLRGPQGVLFGRNVTGGAVLINTNDPTREFEGSVRASVETGLNKYMMATVSGPLIEDKLLGKLAVYRNDDDGWFKNEFDGNKDFGASETSLVRGAITYLPSESSELTVKYEHGESDGDGPAAQNAALFKPGNSFKFAVDEEGFYDNKWDFVSAKFITDLGAGVLTNIFGWRQLENSGLSDIDATPMHSFHSSIALETEQVSNELRYNITFNDRIDVTAGAYYFNQDINYIEERSFASGAVIINGGGTQDQTTYGIFTSVDWRLSDSVTLLTGIRYTQEEKEIELANLGSSKLCSIDSVSCSAFDFIDDESWNNVSPKLGVQWFVNDDTQVYASYSKGFRSGGYNMRNTSPTATPGPFDEEEQDSFEVGIKLDALDGRLRLNAAAFHNEVFDMQREVVVPDETAGFIAVVKNTADATIRGVELELMAAITENLTLGANLGVLDGVYDEVRFDLNGDGVVDGEDKKLDIPRLAEVTGGVNLTWQDTIFAGNSLLARVAYSHRDKAPYNDNNTGILPATDMVDANLSFTTADQAITVSIFGRNLLDEVSFGVNVPLPSSPAFGFSGGRTPTIGIMSTGRVYGVEASYNF
jgi:iron complex outermembrane receptor protein